MKLRKLNDAGIAEFTDYLKQLQANGKLTPPRHLLEDARYSDPVASLDVADRKFESRLEAARYFHAMFMDDRLKAFARDAGVWAWLSLLYFDQICPPKADGVRKPSKEVFRYVPATDNFRKYYRHLLFGPYVIYDSHRNHIDEAMSVLVGPLHIINDVIEQIASRLERVSNRAVIGTATMLYLNAGGNGYKAGAGGKGPGSPRRYSVVLDQFDLTYDLYGMESSELLGLLPKEFNRFRN